MDTDQKNRYDTEAMARTMGQEYAQRAGVELFVYRDAACLGWYLTSTPRADYWNVNHKFRQSDDFADITEDPFFWDRLFGMSDSEADMLLRSLRRQCVDHIEHFERIDERMAIRMRALIRRVNDEIHFFSQRSGSKAWTAAIRQVFGDEGLAKVRIAMLLVREDQALKSRNTERVNEIRAHIEKAMS